MENDLKRSVTHLSIARERVAAGQSRQEEESERALHGVSGEAHG